MEKAKGNIINGILTLSVLNIIGIWFMRSELIIDFYIPVIPIIMVISFAFLVYYQKHWNINAILFMFLTFTAGFLIHVIGVNTGYPFGPYTYIRSILGPQLFNTPMLMGLNWLLLIYTIGILLKNLTFTKVQKSLLGAFMILLYDIVLEPLAKKIPCGGG